MANKDIPYIAFETEMVRLERINKRLWILAIILIAVLLATNTGWIIYESQFEYFETKTVEQEVDADEGSPIVIGMGDYNGNESEAENDND
jgi:hypothetical protein